MVFFLGPVSAVHDSENLSSYKPEPFLYPTDPFTISDLQDPSHDVPELGTRYKFADRLFSGLRNCERVGRVNVSIDKEGGHIFLIATSSL